ncbi:hypothetical protein [Natronincola ferrireducens]|uniref:Uncharacterized protein n=1 Tax=Natronincola ferrireducens TaxID=393762 RepID=A0A1G8YPD2_9FIRM|nr:hypothetical protein [Natronincola ferrireducens]SDK04699.1 hypothetical protein SAMN05660472_00607 [Natronincola ferrireducens]
MELIKGKKMLLDRINKCFFETIGVDEILFYGIIDKEIIHMVIEKVAQMDQDVTFKIIIPNLQDFGLINWFRSHQNLHNNYQIRTNSKCSNQYIVIGDMLIFISGTSPKKYNFIDDGFLCMIDKKSSESNLNLREIFLEKWGGSYDLYL